MYATAVKRVQFEEAAGGDDWAFPYKLIVPGMTAWAPEVDQVVLGMTPDCWRDYSDYGFRRGFGNGPLPDFWDAPFYSANSDDGSGVVMLVDPSTISIIVPYTAMRRMGPGGCSVGVQYRRKDLDTRSTLVMGRLPIIYGVN